MVTKIGYESDIFKSYRFLDASQMHKIFAGTCAGDCRPGCESSCEDSCKTCSSGCSNGPAAQG